MFVRRIRDFLIETRKLGPSDNDRLLLNDIEKYFQQKSDADIDESDFNFLKECFKNRWDNGVDCTLDSSAVDEVWRQLAEALFGEMYLKIIFPTIINDTFKESFKNTDPRDASLLTKTKMLTNFILISGNTVLCRKMSLFEYLRNNNYQKFYACRAPKEFSAFTIDELSRMQRCSPKEISIDFSTGGSPEIFSSFWAFLQETTFPRLQELGKNNPQIVLSLRKLINESQQLMTDEGFSLFKNRFNSFLSELYHYNLNDVNYFYGQPVDKNKTYILQILIEIFNRVNLGSEKKNLKIKIEELGHFLGILNAICEELEQRIHSHEMCQCILVSLFVTKFSCTWVKETITVLDKKKHIPKEFHKIYQELLAPNSSYEVIFNSTDYPKLEGDIPLHFGDKTITPNNWLLCIRKKRFSDVGGYWFKPELILAVLLAYTESEKINNFLNSLINNYMQKDHFDKELRANILFSNFLAGLNKDERESILLKISNFKSEKNFIENCTQYIKRRLDSLHFTYPPLPKSSITFFPQPWDNLPGLVNFYRNLPNIPGDVADFFLELIHQHLTPEEKQRASDRAIAGPYFRT